VRISGTGSGLDQPRDRCAGLRDLFVRDGPAFRRGLGLRIDLVLASNALARRCVASYVDKEPRMLERPSDHAPAGRRGGAVLPTHRRRGFLRSMAAAARPAAMITHAAQYHRRRGRTCRGSTTGGAGKGGWG
jgi:hypothetical protein